MASQFIKTMTSFSGSDLVVTFGKRVLGELQQISWGVQREKAPIYTLGSSDPRSFSRGKRAIAGSCVFAVFDRDALIEEMTKDDVWGEIAPRAMFTAAGNLTARNSETFENALDLINWNKRTSGKAFSRNGSGEQTDTNAAQVGTNITDNSGIDTKGVAGINIPSGFSVITNKSIVYADMLPPLDVTLTFANEYGQAAFQKIYDLDFLNEGSGVSVDSIVMERQMTWIARRISPVMSGVYCSSQGIEGKPTY